MRIKAEGSGQEPMNAAATKNWKRKEQILHWKL